MGGEKGKFAKKRVHSYDANKQAGGGSLGDEYEWLFAGYYLLSWPGKYLKMRKRLCNLLGCKGRKIFISFSIV